MGIYLLMVAGILFAALFALNNLLKTIFRRNKIGFFDLLLAFMTTLVLLAGLIGGQIRAADRMIPLGALAAGGGLVVFSLLITLLELFRAQRLRGSRGILGLYSGGLIIAAVFLVPFTASSLAPPTPTVVVQAVSGQGETTETPEATDALATPTESIPTTAPTRTPTERPTETREPSSTPRPTRTPFVFSTRTPTPTPTLVTPCVASVEYNLRLRTAPNRDSETLLVIPYSTTIELYGKGELTENGGRWWYTQYEGTQGWVDGQYMIVSSACDHLPMR